MPLYAHKNVFGTTAQWTTDNIILEKGEIGAEDTGAGLIVKMGDGTHTWSALSPIGGTASNIIINNSVAPALGTLANGGEYRCITSSQQTAAPTMTLAAIANTSAQFEATVIFTTEDIDDAPTVTNNSGYTLKYRGDDVSGGVFSPEIGKVYRINFVFDGYVIHAYVTGVAV